MTLNKGPSDVDERPYVRCHGCDRLLKCYRGKLLRQVTNEHGTWEQFEFLCTDCLRDRIAEALS